ncbi:Uncharacterized protein Fot_28424 [Forsythia ovata]|uniref:Uncharacterized protein n=1 Tax=Forsythia ovata TaxID=205694 RepID=A0ABD1TNY6_9LAMI
MAKTIQGKLYSWIDSSYKMKIICKSWMRAELQLKKVIKVIKRMGMRAMEVRYHLHDEPFPLATAENKQEVFHLGDANCTSETPCSMLQQLFLTVKRMLFESPCVSASNEENKERHDTNENAVLKITNTTSSNTKDKKGGSGNRIISDVPTTRAHPSIYNPSGQGASDIGGGIFLVPTVICIVAAQDFDGFLRGYVMEKFRPTP